MSHDEPNRIIKTKTTAYEVPQEHAYVAKPFIIQENYVARIIGGLKVLVVKYTCKEVYDAKNDPGYRGKLRFLHDVDLAHFHLANRPIELGKYDELKDINDDPRVIGAEVQPLFQSIETRSVDQEVEKALFLFLDWYEEH